MLQRVEHFREIEADVYSCRLRFSTVEAATNVYADRNSRAERRLRDDLAAFEKRTRESADAYWYGAQSRVLARDDRPHIPTHPRVVAPIPRARRRPRRREPGRCSRARCRRAS